MSAGLSAVTDRLYNLRQRKCHHRVGGDRRNILLSVLALIRERIGIRRLVELERPHFLTSLRIECAESAVINRADKDETACRDDWTCAAGSADVLSTRPQRFDAPERR